MSLIIRTGNSFFPIFLFIAGLQPNLCIADVLHSREPYAIARECLLTNRLHFCREALVRFEELQRYAASQGNYPCQTGLLGLEADFIMTEFNSGRGKAALSLLEEVEQLCQ